MASVFKRGRWVDAHGRKCTKDASGAKWVESRFYTVQVFIDGKPKLVKGYTDKQASEQLGAKLERQKARGDQGLIDPYKAAKCRPTSEHLKDYIADLKAGGRAVKYVANVQKRLERLIAECPWKTLADITADSFRRWREHRQKAEALKGRVKDSNGASARTVNQYLEMAGAFCNWMKPSRMASNPLDDVAKVEGAKVRNRRALTDEEVGRLLAATPESRRLVYRTGLATGLRRSELDALKWGDLRLTGKPFIQLRAEATKAKRADRIALNVTLADDLRKNRGDATDNDRVFPGGVPDIDV
jgi:integrase